MMRRNDYLMHRGDSRNPYGARGGYVDSRSYSNDRDYRNPYGSRGGYVDSRGYDRDMEDMRGRDYRNDYNSNYGEYDSRSYDRDYNRQSSEYNRDYRGYEVRGMMRPMDYESSDKQYEKDLHKWIEKMQKKDRFGAGKEQIIQRAKQMKIQFDEFTEEEFYAIYLAMVTDYKKVANDFNVYIEMAKEFLMDDDISVSPSEKVAIYLYEIVMGGKE